MSIKTSCFVIMLVAGMIVAPSIVSAYNASVEDAVREYFEDAPVMIDIARCESKFRQFAADGSPLYGGWGGRMVGVFQLYDDVHRASATTLGFDIATLDGNMAYAKHLYTMQGTTPWKSSASCWEDASPDQSAQLSDTQIKELQAQVTVLMKIVVQLQELLEQRRVALNE